MTEEHSGETKPKVENFQLVVKDQGGGEVLFSHLACCLRLLVPTILSTKGALSRMFSFQVEEFISGTLQGQAYNKI